MIEVADGHAVVYITGMFTGVETPWHCQCKRWKLDFATVMKGTEAVERSYRDHLREERDANPS